MNETLSQVIIEGSSLIILAVLTFIANWLSIKFGEYIDKKGLGEELKNKRYLAEIAVNAVEQIYHEEDGPQKFHQAKIRLIRSAEQNGINITMEEVDDFIEDAVLALQEGVNHGKNQKTIR